MSGVWLKSYRRMTVILVVLFLLVSFFGTTGSFPFRNMGTYLSIFACIYWTMIMRKRIIQREPRRYLSVIGNLILVLYVLREIRFVYFPSTTVFSRLLWYCYYIPLLGVPLYSLFAAQTVGNTKTGETNLVKTLLKGICAVFILGFLTNDFHQQAFRFASLEEPENYSRGWLYTLALGWIVLFMAGSFLLLLYRARTSFHISKTWLPLLILALVAGLLLPGIFSTRSLVDILGVNLHFQDLFAFGILFFWEACIQIGLIPSNTMYEDIFEESVGDAQIVDKNKNVIYATSEATEVSKEDMSRASSKGTMISDTIRLHKEPISGGYVLWTEDMTPVQELNEELMDLAGQISEENVILQKENELQTQKAEYEIENELYDKLAADLQAKTKQIETLIDVDMEKGNRYLQNLRIACVYCAYLKRRANLFLLTQQNPVVPVLEVQLSVRESLEYLKLLKVQSASHVYGDGELSGEDALELYDTFELLLEKLLPFLETCLVTVNGEERGGLQIAAALKEEKVPGGIGSLTKRLEMPGLSTEWDEGTLFLRWRKEAEA